MANGDEKTRRIAARGKARAEKRAARKTQRTERLAARKNITTSQAKRLQENRRVRFREFASGGTENITTGRLRFSSDPSGESTPAGATTPTDVAANDREKARSAFGSSKPTIDQQGIFGTNLRASDFRTQALDTPGMRDMNRGRTASVDVGEHGLGDIGLSDEKFEGFSKRARGAAGYGS